MCRITWIGAAFLMVAMGVSCKEQPGAVPSAKPLPKKFEIPASLPPDHPITKELHILREMIYQRSLLLQKEGTPQKDSPRLIALEQGIKDRIENLEKKLLEEPADIKTTANSALKELKLSL
jgi:hypothetical protein